MLRLILPFSAVLTIAAALPSGTSPRFTLNQDRNINGNPSISITFPDGYTDNLKLYKANDKDDDECLYSGYLEKETSACLAMTGCPGIEDVEFTIFSKHATRSRNMKWNLDGTVDILDQNEIPNKVSLSTLRADDGWEAKEGDEKVNQTASDSEVSIEESCADGSCDDQIQRTHVLNYKIFFDDKYLAKHGDVEEARKQLRAVMVHVQAHFCHESLGSKVMLERCEEMEHLAGEIWPAHFDSLERTRKLTKEKLGMSDLAIFFGHHPWGTNPGPGFGGVAYLGVACSHYPKEIKHSLNFWWYYASLTAGVVSHEIGHNLGMRHDNSPDHVKAGCHNTGIMTGQGHEGWSTCSRADFEAHYLKFKENWCMPKSECACTDPDAE